MSRAWLYVSFITLAGCMLELRPEREDRLLRDPVTGRCMIIPAAGEDDDAWSDWQPCAEATRCTGDAECGDGSHCSTRDGDCGLPPGCDPGEVCPRVCGGVCVPDAPAPCASDEGCGAGFYCSTREGDCRPPFDCVDGDACPAVCTGVCLPEGIPHPSMCYAIGDEAACVANATCEPIYEGLGCSCDASGCGCEEYRFAECRPAAPGCDADPAETTPSGSWTSREGTPLRVYEFVDTNDFLVHDHVSPCPDDAECVWSGIVTRSGTWSAAPDGSIALAYRDDASWPGLVYATQLAFEGCFLVEIDTGRTFRPGGP